MPFLSESTTSCSLLLRCFEGQGSGQFSHRFSFFVLKKKKKKFVQILGEYHFPLGHLVKKRQPCFTAPGQKASKKPLNGVHERKSPLKGDRGDLNCR